MDLFNILTAIIDNAGDMIKDRAVVEQALSAQQVDAYADNGMGVNLSTDQAELISKTGLAWVAAVNEGNGEWSRMMEDAKAALSNEA